uniref:Aconitase A/isopropylmalate dehydratase small subunit swivel domain-containing protein n=1 Tax=Chenopodium quinoa TaxID=63459 RepID=A0A803L5G7_CHEQI
MDHYPLRFVEDDGIKSKYSIIIAGNNFGCGREHAAVDALSDAGTRAVVAESYDGVFLKNSNSSGLIFALESEVRICDEFKTGDVATVDVEERVLVNQTTGIVYQLKAVAADAGWAGLARIASIGVFRGWADAGGRLGCRTAGMGQGGLMAVGG